MSKKVYKFVGKGEGVPGLPHVITEEDAKALGVVDLLKAAVEAGTYKVQGIKKKKEGEK